MKQIILYILIILSFTSCVQQSEKKVINMEQNEILNSFIGKWGSLERVIPYKSYLIINKDSTFHFEFGACSTSGFSTGKWEIKDSTIRLKSTEIDSCVSLFQFGKDCISIVENDTSEFVTKKTISNCNQKQDENYVEFNTEEFYIDNDTLKHLVKKPKLCPEIRNDFSRIKKETTANN